MSQFAQLVAITVAVICVASSASAGQKLSELPIPIQAYVMMEAVKVGVAEPMAVEVARDWSGTFEPRFDIPGAPDSDINQDGYPDYAVAMCFFAYQGVNIHQTNGFPCATGNLILSNRFGGYDFLDLGGLVIKSQPDKANPQIVVLERGFGVACEDSYYCDIVYRIGSDRSLEKVKACQSGQCTLP